MLSRVANSIYWMSRYLERADNVARFIDVNLRLMLDMCRSRESAQWAPLLSASGDHKLFDKFYKKASEKNVVKFLTFDERNPNSILSCIKKARENARTIREVISSELWGNINRTYHLVEKFSRKRRIDDMQAFCLQVKASCSLITGMSHDTILRMGKML